MRKLYFILTGLVLTWSCAAPPPVDPTPDYIGTYICTFQSTSIDHRVNNRILHNSGTFTNLIYQVADQTVELRDADAIYSYGVWATISPAGFSVRETIIDRRGGAAQSHGGDYKMKVTGAGRLIGPTLSYLMRYVYFPIEKKASDSTVTILSVCTCQKK